MFNVINISEDANNPPPAPYLDITNLVNELNRLESIKFIVDEGQTASTSDVTGVVYNVHELRIANDALNQTVYDPYLETLLRSPLLSQDESEGDIAESREILKKKLLLQLNLLEKLEMK